MLRAAALHRRSQVVGVDSFGQSRRAVSGLPEGEAKPRAPHLPFLEPNMSEKETTAPEVRPEEPELSDEALEQVAGGCQIDSQLHDPLTIITPTFPTY